MLPDVLLDIIADYAAEEFYLDWIPEVGISEISYYRSIKYEKYSRLAVKKIVPPFNFIECSHPDFITDTNYLTFSNLTEIEKIGLMVNPHPRTLKMVIDNMDDIDNLGLLCANPGVIEWIKSKIEVNGFVNYKMLSMNPHPWVLEYFRTHMDKINWVGFAKNIGITYTKRPDLRGIFANMPK